MNWFTIYRYFNLVIFCAFLICGVWFVASYFINMPKELALWMSYIMWGSFIYAVLTILAIMLPTHLALRGYKIPLCFQRLFFECECVRMKKLCESRGPLFSYPFMFFLELELPKIFQEKGLQGCNSAIADWFEKREKELVTVTLRWNRPDVFIPPERKLTEEELKKRERGRLSDVELSCLVENKAKQIAKKRRIDDLN